MVRHWSHGRPWRGCLSSKQQPHPRNRSGAQWCCLDYQLRYERAASIGRSSRSTTRINIVISWATTSICPWTANVSVRQINRGRCAVARAPDTVYLVSAKLWRCGHLVLMARTACSRLLSQSSFGNPTRRPPPPPAPPGELDEAVADALSNYENRGKGAACLAHPFAHWTDGIVLLVSFRRLFCR